MAVLIKGQSIKCSQKSRDHYLRGPENRKITVLEVFGFATRNADEALAMIELSAKGTRCKKPLYSAKINPEPDRIWKREEVRQAVDMLEKNLGLTGNAHVVVEHVKKGRVHYHVLWSRFPPEGGPAKNMGNDYAVHRKTQREIEKAFKLKPMNARGRDFKLWEVEWAKRYGYDIFKMREQITKTFNGSKSGQEFKAKLESLGIVLCRGDKSQFVIILPWGQHKVLSSMIRGRPTKVVLRRALADIDISKLPTIDEGKAQVMARLPKAKSRTRKKPHGRIGKSGSRERYRRQSRGKRRGRSWSGSRFRARGSYPWRPSPPRSWQPYGFRLTAPWPGAPAGYGGMPNGLTPAFNPADPLSSGLSSNVARIAAINAARDKKAAQETMPRRPIAPGTMSKEQLADYFAACEGRITWKQYFAKWGNRGLTP